MKSVYHLQVLGNDPPDNVDFFPPSFYSTEWYNQLMAYVESENFLVFQKQMTFVFDDDVKLNEFLDQWRLTDPQMIADLAAWHTSHGITLVQSFYHTTDITPRPTPVFPE